FKVQLERAEPALEPEPEKAFVKKTKSKAKSKRRRAKSRQPLGEIIEVHGEAPPQYPDYDEDW
ncbi:MAG: hypothetical protein AAGC54_16815, partial [Cyanobacteria bacterium P01_F01_bin.4]